MAASTSAAASTSTAADSCYDVFISHRGPDVKKTFASHLYRRLISYGLRVFLDYKELQEGEDFPCQIKGAISAASLHVAIFSRTYADSPWCLEELVLMLESGTKIIPVFYDVKPTELRRTDGEGRYATSLRKLEEKKNSDSQPRYDSETIENWKKALSQVADISGLDLEAFKGDEGDLVEEIVEVVFRKGVKTPLTVARYPTGLAEKVQDFETKVLLQQCSERVQIVGITGLGGVGKTTLALELFNRKRSNYRDSCFLSDVREKAKNSLDSLQSQLLKGLRSLELPIENRHAGIEKLKKHLSSCKVLLVLDDVDHQDQVFALLPQLNDLHHDSLIFITSRDKDVLRRSGVQESSIYLLRGLNTECSRELFCSHAFCNPHPLPGFESLVTKFLTACNGLPLSLKVFGGLLCGNTDKSYWKDELEELRKTLPDDIQKSLQISYDALKREEQEIFLDIACFFIGKDRDTAIRVWDGSGWNGKRGFQSLVNKCLVEVYMEDNYQHLIRMHDHLRDMGRDLANRSGFPCRLWCGTKQMEDLLEQSSEATRVRGIRMFPREHYDERSDTDEDDERASFSRYKMKNLQILDIHEEDDDLLKCLLDRVDSPNLLYLRWLNCPCFSLPPYIPMKKLRVLEVEGDKLETLWQEDLQAPLQLRELRIRNSWSFNRLSDSFGNLSRLEHIINLSRFWGLKRLPDSFGNLSRLEYINLSACHALKRLPDSFGNLSRLEYINLSECRALERLPDSFGNLSRLEHINLSYCSALGRLPDSFGNLIKLEYLDLRGCDKLTIPGGTFREINPEHMYFPEWCINVFPPQIAHQWSLENLLLYLINLTEWPSATGEACHLERLVLKTPFLEALPPSFGNDLRNLKCLELQSCRSLKRLPDSFLLLNQLVDLRVEDCSPELDFRAVEGENETSTDSGGERTSSNLERFLPRLQHLTLLNTHISEVSFPTCVFPDLQCLDIRDCPDLVEVTLPNALRSLNLHECSKLRKIGAPFPTGACADLQDLHIIKCNDLMPNASFNGLMPNESAFHYAFHYASFNDLMPNASFHYPSFKDLAHVMTLGHGLAIEEVEISNFSKLRKIGGSFSTGVCPNFQDLSIHYCENLVELEILPTAFQHLKISKCENLVELEILPTVIQHLKIRKCEELVEFDCPNPQLLEIWPVDCQELVEVGTLPNALLQMQLINCPKMREIEQLCGFTKLRTLEVSRRKEVEKPPSIECNTETLRESRGQRALSNSDSLFDKCLLRLQHLELDNLQISQVSFPTGVCPNLQHLHIRDCEDLIEVRTLPNALIKLHLDRCPKLRLIRIEELAQVMQLREMRVGFCDGLEEMVGIGYLKSLEVMQVIRCTKLKIIQGLEQLTQLRELDFSYCFELEELLGVGHLKSLEVFKATMCQRLKRIRGLEQLTLLRLRELDISYCSELETLS